jgi:hypothetical protein
MTTYYSNQQVVPGSTSQFSPRGYYNQAKKVSIDTYTAAALAQNSIIQCWTPPANFVFTGGMLYFAALGASTDLEVGVGATLSGTAANATLFLGSTSTSSAGNASLEPASASASSLLYTFDGGTPIIITVSGAGAITGLIVLRTEGYLMY